MAYGLSPLLLYVLAVVLATVFSLAHTSVRAVVVSGSEQANAETRPVDNDFSILDHTHVFSESLNGASPEVYPHQVVLDAARMGGNLDRGVTRGDSLVHLRGGSISDKSVAGSELYIMARGETDRLAKEGVADEQGLGTPKQRHRRLLDANDTASASGRRSQKPNDTDSAAAKARTGDAESTPTPTYYPGVSNDELIELLQDDYSPAEAMGPSGDILGMAVETFEDSQGGVAPKVMAASPAIAVQQDAAAKSRPTADGQAGGATKWVPAASDRTKSDVPRMPQPSGGATKMHAGGAAGPQPVSAEAASEATKRLIGGAAQVSGRGSGNPAGRTVPQTQAAGDSTSTGKTMGGDVSRTGGDTSGDAGGTKAAQIGREGDKLVASDVAAKEAADTAAGASAAQRGPEGTTPSEGADPGPAGPEVSDAGSATATSQLKSRWVSLEEASHHENGATDGGGRSAPGAQLEGVPQESFEEHPVFISEQAAFAGSEDDYQDNGEDDPMEDEEEEDLPKYVDLEKGHRQGVWERKARSKGYLDPDNNFDEFAKPSKKKRKRDEAKFFDFLTMREIRAEDVSNKGGLTIAWAWDAVAGGNDLSDLWHVWEKRQEREFHTSLTFGTVISVTGCIALVVWLIARCLKQRKKGQERGGGHSLGHPSPARETMAQKVRKRRLFAWTHNRSD